MTLKSIAVDAEGIEEYASDLPRRSAKTARFAARRVRGRLRFLVGERQHRLYLLDVEKIDYIEANGNYVKIHSADCDFISRDSISRLEALLMDDGFLRIQRAVLLSIRGIVYAQSAGHGRFAFTLSCGACLCSSASYREIILSVLPLEPQSKRAARDRAAPSSARRH